MKTIRLWLLTLGVLLFFVTSATAQGTSPLILTLTADGTVAPAMKEYIRRGIQAAEQQDAEVLILQLNTPGGLISDMEAIVQDIRASRVPVVVYVTPRGGIAGSAGAFITIAGHASAMAPETAIGAASPISGDGTDIPETLERKQKEALRALVRSLTENRPAEAVAVAEEMVETARAISASEALQVGLVDFIADDLDTLIRQLNGFTVQMPTGPRTLQTSDARVQSLGMSFIEQLLDILVNPNIVFLLLGLGVQAILIEISSPGGWVAGFIGAVCLALGAYGLGILPVNWFGLLILLISFALFFLELKTPTYGGLTAAGIGTFIIGALVLFNSANVPDFFQVSVPLVVGVGIITGILFALLMGMALRAQFVPHAMGQETLTGQVGIAKSKIGPHGQVQLNSELWSADLAEGEKPIPAGEQVIVDKIDGLRLKVRRGSQPGGSNERKEQ